MVCTGFGAFEFKCARRRAAPAATAWRHARRRRGMLSESDGRAKEDSASAVFPAARARRATRQRQRAEAWTLHPAMARLARGRRCLRAPHLRRAGRARPVPFASRAGKKAWRTARQSQCLQARPLRARAHRARQRKQEQGPFALSFRARPGKPARIRSRGQVAHAGSAFRRDRHPEPIRNRSASTSAAGSGRRIRRARARR